MRRFVLAMWIASAVALVPLSGAATAADTYHGTYSDGRFFCGKKNVTKAVGASVSGRWSLNVTPSGAEIVSIVFLDGKLHAAFPWTGLGWWMSPASDNDPDGGYYHYEWSGPLGAAEAKFLASTGKWEYRVRLASVDCSGPDATALSDTGVFFGTWNR